MSRVQMSAVRTIPAPADAVYALLSDYHEGHPGILPPAYSDFTVIEGGTGAGTRIIFTLTLAGRSQEAEGIVAEPEPGRVLTETYAGNGSVTTFTVDPIGDASRLRIETTWESRPGIVGFFERLIVPRMLQRLYREELDLIEQWAQRREHRNFGSSPPAS